MWKYVFKFSWLFWWTVWLGLVLYRTYCFSAFVGVLFFWVCFSHFVEKISFQIPWVSKLNKGKEDFSIQESVWLWRETQTDWSYEQWWQKQPHQFPNLGWEESHRVWESEPTVTTRRLIFSPFSEHVGTNTGVPLLVNQRDWKLCSLASFSSKNLGESIESDHSQAVEPRLRFHGISQRSLSLNLLALVQSGCNRVQSCLRQHSRGRASEGGPGKIPSQERG